MCTKENLLLITAKRHMENKEVACSKRSLYYVNEEVQFISQPR